MLVTALIALGVVVVVGGGYRLVVGKTAAKAELAALEAKLLAEINALKAKLQ
jgi:hypothetical protein